MPHKIPGNDVEGLLFCPFRPTSYLIPGLGCANRTWRQAIYGDTEVVTSERLTRLLVYRNKEN